MIELAYADTSLGKWLIFYGPVGCDADFVELSRSIEKLEHGAGEIVLSELPFVNAVGSIRLVATCSSRGTGIRKLKGSTLDYVWSQPGGAWNNCVGLMEVLRGHGHQHLSYHPADDAIVALSLGEYAYGHFSSPLA